MEPIEGQHRSFSSKSHPDDVVESSTEERVQRIAVIGVHGVAHHEPGATANAMSDLLLSLPARHGGTLYEPFSATGIRVPLSMPPVRPLPQTSRSKIGLDVFQEKSVEFAEVGKQYAGRLEQSQSVAPGQAGNAYMRLLLQDYRGGANGNFYQTTRLEGVRARTETKPAAEVHIYEMLWADLARPTNTILSFLLSLFQLVLHLGSLSRLAIDSGSAENRGWVWNTFRAVQRYAVRMLQIPIPLLKVTLLITLFSCVPTFAGAGDSELFVLGMAGLAGLIVTYLANRGSTREVKGSQWIWSLRAGLPAAVVVGVALLLRSHLSLRALSAVECWVILGSALIFYVLKSYESVRPGVFLTGALLYVGLLALYVRYLLALETGLNPVQQATLNSVQYATLWTSVWILAALRLSWLILFALALLGLGLGSLAWRSIPKIHSEKRARARAAVRTARFALALPSLLFLLITTLLWAGMFSLAHKIHDPFFDADVLSLPARGRWLPRYSLVLDPTYTRNVTDTTCDPHLNPGCAKTKLARIEPLPESAYREKTPEAGQLARIRPVPNGESEFKPDYLKDVLEWSVTDGFAIALIVSAGALFLVVWWVLPGVMTETFPLRGHKEPPRWSTNEQTTRLGSWTSRGLDATSVITFLLWSAIFVVPPLFLLAPLFRGIPIFHDAIADVYHRSGDWSRVIVHSFIAAATAAFLAGAIHYGSSVLGAILDVDTYLRTSPKDATPRAKIAERYISLLRYLTQYQGADGRGYDSIVIVAHSLGTLISADLLRFLRAEGLLEQIGVGVSEDQDHKRVSIKLLTMGSPIRQLLNRFFPFLYDWVRAVPDNGLKPLPSCAVTPTPIGANDLPDPADLGVTKWVNVYRSGDYVGRSLWLDEWYRRTAGGNSQGLDEVEDPLKRPLRREACIGAGAHTHYWDDTAPDVARILDSLIAL